MSDLILREQLLTSFQTLKSDFMASLVDAADPPAAPPRDAQAMYFASRIDAAGSAAFAPGASKLLPDREATGCHDGAYGTFPFFEDGKWQ